MLFDPIQSAAFGFASQVESRYQALIAGCDRDGEEPNLGGKLLYSGELDPHSRALLVAANIAGAASLAATADTSAQKQAVRDGVADFLVNSLDEALRILKNEIRKQLTVAVCVSISPKAMEQEMIERGVAPDLLQASSQAAFAGLPARLIDVPPTNPEQTLLCWSVQAFPAQTLPKLDAIALESFSHSVEARAAQRWLRLAPRYLGRLAPGFRVLSLPRAAADEFVSRVRIAVEQRHIETGVRIDLNRDEHVFLFEPPNRP